jgi:hypothetical protein
MHFRHEGKNFPFSYKADFPKNGSVKSVYHHGWPIEQGPQEFTAG